MENEIEVLTPTPVEGISAEPETQVTEPTSKDADQLQNTGQTEVDSSDNKTSSEPAERPKASDFYLLRKTRKELNELKEQNRMILERLQQQNKNSSVASSNELTPESIEQLKQTDPIKWVEVRDAQIRQEIETFKNNLPSQIQQIRESEKFVNEEQEALNKLFPKSSNDADEDLDYRMQQDTVRTKHIQSIINNYGLSDSLNRNPVKTANAILLIYENTVKSQNQTPVNPSAPKKSQLMNPSSGKASSTNVSSSKSLNEILTELDKMNLAVQSDPSLINDDEYKKSRSSLNAKYNEIYKQMLGQ